MQKRMIDKGQVVFQERAREREEREREREKKKQGKRKQKRIPYTLFYLS